MASSSGSGYGDNPEFAQISESSAYLPKQPSEVPKRQRTVIIDPEHPQPELRELLAKMKGIISKISFDNSQDVLNLVKTALQSHGFSRNVEFLDSFYSFSQIVEGVTTSKEGSFWREKVHGIDHLAKMIVENLTEEKNTFKLNDVPYIPFTLYDLETLLYHCIYDPEDEIGKMIKGGFPFRKVGMEVSLVDLKVTLQRLLRVLNHETRNFVMELNENNVRNICEYVISKIIILRDILKNNTRPKHDTRSIQSDLDTNSSISNIDKYINGEKRFDTLLLGLAVQATWSLPEVYIKKEYKTDFSSQLVDLPEASRENERIDITGRHWLSNVLSEALWKWCDVRQLSGDQKQIPSRLNIEYWIRTLASERQRENIYKTLDYYKDKTHHDALFYVIQRAVRSDFFAAFVSSLEKMKAGVNFDDPFMLQVLKNFAFANLVGEAMKANKVSSGLTTSGVRLAASQTGVAIAIDQARKSLFGGAEGLVQTDIDRLLQTSTAFSSARKRSSPEPSSRIGRRILY